MDDSELQAIRAARLAELQRNTGQEDGGSGGGQQLQQQSANSGVLAQVLEPAARERLLRVRIVRPERADLVENHIVRMAQSGQLRRRLGEEEVVKMLDGLARDLQKLDGKVVFARREVAAASDDDSDDFFD